MKQGDWAYCDPVAWGLTKGCDEMNQVVRSWTYGYGFSYVFRRKAGIDMTYTDVNLGEDYAFINKLVNTKGDNSVALFHDNFGICLHNQHGGNTSQSIPLRSVSLDEALNLDIMELAPHWQSNVEVDRVRPVGGLFATRQPPPSERSRLVVAHFPNKDVSVTCGVKATAADFLKLAEEALGAAFTRYRIFRVVPSQEERNIGDNCQDLQHTEEDTETRDQFAAEVLGITFLMELEHAAENLQPHTRSGIQWRKLLEQAKEPMNRLDRIGLRTKELWLLPPAEGEDEDLDCDVHVVKEKFIKVQVTNQASNVQQFLSASSTFSVRLHAGSKVADLRGMLGTDLPTKAKVITVKKGKGLETLKDSETVPAEVSVSEFTGNKKCYAWLTRCEAITGLQVMRKILKRKEIQKQLDQAMELAAGNNNAYKGRLAKLLKDDVYPQLFHVFDLPYEDLSGKFWMDGMARFVFSDIEVCRLWLEVEELMRNVDAIATAKSAIQYLEEKASAPS